jgi:ferritin-like protein
MTPKEKAEELINIMHNTEHCNIKHVPNERYCDCISMNAFQAKQCALKAVNEMINCLNDDDLYIQGESNIDGFINFYKEVKQEIEKL